jgi:hypothetical protein
MELRIVECASIQIQFQFGGRLSLGSESSSFEAAPRLHFDCSDSENQQIFRRAKNRRMSFIQIQFQFGGRLSLGSESVAIDLEGSCSRAS